MSAYELNHQKLEMFHRNFINVFWNIVTVGDFISLRSEIFVLDLSSNIHLSIYCRNLKIWFERLLMSSWMILNKEDFLFYAWPVYGLWKVGIWNSTIVVQVRDEEGVLLNGTPRNLASLCIFLCWIHFFRLGWPNLGENGPLWRFFVPKWQFFSNFWTF